MQCITFERYIEGFHLLERYSEEYPFMLRHFLDVSEKKFPQGFSLLDIGAGTGQFIGAILEKSRVPVRQYMAIEPSPDHVRNLEAAKEKFQEKYPVAITIVPECFTPQTDPGKKFDIVLLSHSTYCFLPDPEPYLLHAISLARPGGNVIIYNGTPANFCTVLNLLHRDILPKNRITNPFFTSWQIRDILEKHSIPHAVTYLPGFLRAGEIFRPENGHLMNELITFSLMVEAGSLEAVTRARTAEFLRDIAYLSPDGPLLNLGVDAITVEI
ncbi:class I SAM-dependent methyltransferase [Methanoregula sp.]|uniref:class I SAM-dependent methyltransferase n=1 Tax=Methanoregula sp. TaxID=2052170 RepID=UPI002632A15E|nr:class I SAM-dependent methyltransferase [Methanoregula sp.]MDD5144226.1 class I SAM-dependent methyltransferase [Methanoregula sp.]